MTVAQDLAGITLGRGFRFFVGCRRTSGADPRQLNVAKDVAAFLRGACAKSLKYAREREPKAYAPDAVLEPEEVLVVDRADFESGLGIDVLVAKPGTPGYITAAELKRKKLAYYAVVTATSEKQHAVFVRRGDPLMVPRPGRFPTLLGESLVRLEQPVLTLDEEIDLIAVGDYFIVLKLAPFEGLFKDSEFVRRNLPTWLGHLTSRITFLGDGAAKIQAVAERDSRIRRRLEDIYRRGHLKKTTIEEIEKKAHAAGIDTSDIIVGGKAVFDENNRFKLLRVLNEEPYSGFISGTRWYAERRSAQ